MKKLAVGALAACVAVGSLSANPYEAPPFHSDIPVWNSPRLTHWLPDIDGAAGDINGDGHIDLVTVSPGSGLAMHPDGMVAFGQADGSFSPPIIFGWRASGVAIADFDDDGIRDVAIVSDVGSWLFRSTRGGIFSQPIELHTPATRVRAADINGDGLTDLVLINGDDVSVRLRSGPATFGPPQLVANGAASGVTVGRVNADSAEDIMIGSTLYLARVEGGFEPPIETGITDVLSIADMNADGLGDLIFQTTLPWHNTDNGAVAIALNSPAGFTPMAPARVYCPTPLLAAVADWNGDGALDLAVGSTRFETTSTPAPVGRRIALISGNGLGELGEADMRAAGGVGTKALLVADVDADNVPDLITVNRGSRVIYLPTRETALSARSVYALLNRNGEGPGAVRDILPGVRHSYGTPLLHDIDGDGDIDYLNILGVSGGQQLTVRLNQGDGRFSELPVFVFSSTSMPSSAGGLTLEDVSGTGHREPYIRGWGVLRPTSEQQPDGYHPEFALRVQNPGPLPSGLWQNVIRADVDGDGIDEYIHWRTGANLGFRITYRRPQGEFELVTGLFPQYTPIAMTTGQFNLQPALDIAMISVDPYNHQCQCYPNRVLVILSGNGDGTFEVQQEVPVAADVRSIKTFPLREQVYDALILWTSEYPHLNPVAVAVAGSSGQYTSEVFETGIQGPPVVYRPFTTSPGILFTVKPAPGDANYIRPFNMEAWGLNAYGPRRMAGPFPVGLIGGTAALVTPVDIDGNRTQDLVLTGANGGGAWIVRSAIPPPRPPCVGDLNFDRMVDASDLSIMLSALAYPDNPMFGGRPDLNQDGRIDGADLSVFLFRFGQPCP